LKAHGTSPHLSDQTLVVDPTEKHETDLVICDDQPGRRAVLGVVASLLGVNRYLTANGLNLGALLGFALVMGFGGAIISLLISKPMAKWSAGVQSSTARLARRGLDRRDRAQVCRQGRHRHARSRHL
jgi:Zn-dependent protease with chaperone function